MIFFFEAAIDQKIHKMFMLLLKPTKYQGRIPSSMFRLIGARRVLTHIF